jgi:hypothetical protein
VRLKVLRSEKVSADKKRRMSRELADEAARPREATVSP